MRKVDVYAGTPLCFALTLFDKIYQRFKQRPPTPPADTNNIKRVLFIELAETGGLVVACPALQRTRELYPDAEIHFMTFSLGKGILDAMQFPKEHQIIIRTAGLSIFLQDTLKAIRKIRSLQFDAVVNLETFARFSAMLAYLSNAPRRAGFARFHDEGRYVGALTTHNSIYNPHVHAGATFLGLVESLSETPDMEPRVKKSLDQLSLELPKIPLSQERRTVIQNKVRELYPDYSPQKHKLVLLNPNASDLVITRRWPETSFLTLGAALLEQENALIALTGAPNERPAVEALHARFNHERVLNMAGRTADLRQLIDLYNISQLLITNDSGPAHFASLTNMPVLVMFGPETPDIYGPLGENVEAVYLGLACSPCVSAYNQKRSPCTDNQCMKQIPPELMIEKALNILNPA